MSKAAAQNIRSVARAIHPVVHDLLGSRLAFSDILASGFIGDLKLFHHIEWGAVGR